MLHRSIVFVSALALLTKEAPVVNAWTQKTLAPTTTKIERTPEPTTPEPTPSPTPEPTPEPTTPEPTLSPITSAPTPCANRLFYIITIDGITKCSNGYDAQPDSLDFFESSTECCAYLTKNDESMLDATDADYCKVIDVCNPTDAPTESPTNEPTPSPTPEPTPAPTEVEIIITPEPTDDPTPSPTPEPTPQPTTSSPTPEPTNAPVTDEPTDAPVTPAPTPCSNRLFYLITIDGVTKCSNGYDTSTDSELFFETSAECCAELIMMEDLLDATDADYCKVIDVCNPTDAPTDSPTDEPTPSPTPEPTPKPTNAPVTDEPTPAPVTDEPTYEPTTVVMIEETVVPTNKPTCPDTPAPTPCGNRLFFIITDIEGVQKCSNGMENVVDSPESYAAAVDCCTELGFFPNPNDKDTPNAACKYIDVCNPTDEPTLSPTLAPVTSNPTPSPVTPAPVTPAPVETAEPTSYVSGVEVITTPAPTACEERMFYIITDIDGETKCSNGMANSDPLMTSVGAYETVVDCCDKLVLDGVADCNENCKSIDICNPTLEPTLSPTMPPIIAVTPVPTTPAPYDTSFPTQVITPPPVPDEIVTFEPTVGSSIGSTPTVGKEMDILSIATGPRL